VKAAQLLRQQRFTVVPATEIQVEQRSLADYDTALDMAEFDTEVAW
jgi:hypothetical protein